MLVDSVFKKVLELSARKQQGCSGETVTCVICAMAGEQATVKMTAVLTTVCLQCC